MPEEGARLGRCSLLLHYSTNQRKPGLYHLLMFSLRKAKPRRPFRGILSGCKSFWAEIVIWGCVALSKIRHWSLHSATVVCISMKSTFSPEMQENKRMIKRILSTDIKTSIIICTSCPRSLIWLQRVMQRVMSDNTSSF